MVKEPEQRREDPGHYRTMKSRFRLLRGTFLPGQNHYGDPQIDSLEHTGRLARPRYQTSGWSIRM